ncbi:SPARC- modular calcium-binding protein 2 [Nowakowskiella sp. JEL0078]|nr:SPARC- modular calcium-binding protein 2 [Nowakowskiella sp. JEL0078]
MLKWGNGKANWYWEYELPNDMEPPEGAIDPWIRAKYERKQYAKKGAIPDPSTISLPGVSELEVSKAPEKKATPKINSSVTSILPSASNIFPVVSQAPIQLVRSASDNLFEAFQAAPAVPQQATETITVAPPTATNSLKANIMSLYNSPKAAATSLNMGPTSPTPEITTLPEGAQFFSQTGFADFGAFVSTNKTTPMKSWDTPTFMASNTVPLSNGKTWDAFGVPTTAAINSVNNHSATSWGVSWDTPALSTPAPIMATSASLPGYTITNSSKLSNFSGFGNAAQPKVPDFAGFVSTATVMKTVDSLDSLSIAGFASFDQQTTVGSVHGQEKKVISGSFDDWGAFQ